MHNLLNAYARPETRDNAARQRLLREYWFYDDQLRRMLFEQLSQQGQLYPELAAIRTANPRCRERTVRPGAGRQPGCGPVRGRGRKPGSRILRRRRPPRVRWPLHIRAGANSPARRRHSTVRWRRTIRATPKSPYPCRLASRAPIRAKRASSPGWATSWPIANLFTRARVYWERMPAAQPGNPEAYLDAATVYWDYYRYNDALRWIARRA